MVESFKNAGVVDGQLVKQDADDERNSSRNLKAALNKPPDEPLGLFGFDCQYESPLFESLPLVLRNRCQVINI